MIYYSSVLFIIVVYFYILHYVLTLSVMERYRRRRQRALLSRILFLLLSLIIPGLYSSFHLVCWSFSGSIESYSWRISSLLDTIGHAGAALTIFLSHTKLRRQYYPRNRPMSTRTPRSSQARNSELIVLKKSISAVQQRAAL